MWRCPWEHVYLYFIMLFLLCCECGRCSVSICWCAVLVSFVEGCCTLLWFKWRLVARLVFKALGVQELDLFAMSEQNCILLNWNVRGLNNKARRDVVCNLVRDTRATIVALQETKLAVVNDEVVKETLGNRFCANYVFVPATGTCGGILLAVDEEHYSILNFELGAHSVTVLLSATSGRAT